MTTEIRIRKPDDDKLERMEEWLKSHVGPGGRHLVRNSFMGTSDWYYYEDHYFENVEEVQKLKNGDPNEFDEEIENGEPYLDFTFRRDNDATLFGLMWLR